MCIAVSRGLLVFDVNVWIELGYRAGGPIVPERRI